MRLLIQRVAEAAVKIDGRTAGEIGEGLLLFLGIEEADTEMDVDYLCRKAVRLRVFDDEKGVMNRSIRETGGEILVVSQFTLHASTRKGNRPSYVKAAKQPVALAFYNSFCRQLSAALGKAVQTGEFGADMRVSLVNNGPVTIWIDSKTKE